MTRDDPDPRLLLEHTTTSAATRLEDAEVALLPTGAIEQHGPALPLGTDILTARAFAEGVDRDDVIVLPGVPVGVSDHHRQFHGTLSASPETFGAYVEEILASLEGHGVRKAVVVNGHGGNSDALAGVARRLRTAETVFAVPWNWWGNLGDDLTELFDLGDIGHADEVETSVVLAVAERLVREGALDEAEAGGAASWGESVAGARLPYDALDFTDNGAVGSPTRASREAGDRLAEAARADLDTLVEWLAERPFESLLPPSHR
jgi:creatinine amidohydrolase